MTFDVRLRPEAEEDLSDAAFWYEGQRPGLGKQFLDEVLAICTTSLSVSITDSRIQKSSWSQSCTGAGTRIVERLAHNFSSSRRPGSVLAFLGIPQHRTFDENGKETNGTGTPPLPACNEQAKRQFDKGVISLEDDWSFELIPQEILSLPAGTAIGAEAIELSEIQDVVLSMEYDITPGAP